MVVETKRIESERFDVVESADEKWTFADPTSQGAGAGGV